MFLFLAATSVTVVSCDKDDDEATAKSCTELLQDVSTTTMDYAADPTKENCNAYKDAMNAYIDGCDGLTQDAIDMYNEYLAALDCDAL